MDFKQIAQNLNELFSKPGERKLIFWYDAEAGVCQIKCVWPPNL